MITIQAGYALVVDDEPANRDFLERLLQTAHFKVVGATTGKDATEAAQKVPELALALIDHQLPDMTGLQLVRQFRANYPETLIVMATMHDDREIIDQAFEAGIDVFLVKPHGFMELYRRLLEVDNNTALLRGIIIDQYGVRQYRGTVIGRRVEGAAQASKSDPNKTAPLKPETAAAVTASPTTATPSALPISTTTQTLPVVTPPPATSTAPAAPTMPANTDKNTAAKFDSTETPTSKELLAALKAVTKPLTPPSNTPPSPNKS